MTEMLQAQMEKLRNSISGLEAQRTVLGDAIIEPALAAMRSQLAALEAQTVAEQTATEARQERRIVTILFIDMVGSTTMAEKLDPEEWRQVVEQMHAALGEAVKGHGGEVAQYLGDGLLAFFGARAAGEDDPENAVRAALHAQTQVEKLDYSQRVQIRAGINTGLVVVGELGSPEHREFTASGDAINLAARLQSAAPPGGVLISHSTYRYVRGVFDVTPRPPLPVKGKSEPLQTYLVRRAKPRPFRSVARGVAGVDTSTVGRGAEINVLHAAYLRAYEGHGVVWAQLVGEPGVGKSRLLADLRDWTDLRDETCRLLRARAFSDDGRRPLGLVRRLWFDRFQIPEHAPLDQAEAKWVERFAEFAGSRDCEEAAHALGLLVGLPFEGARDIGTMRGDPAQLKDRALAASRELLGAARRRYLVMVMLEDLQYADAASWEYLVEVFLRDEAAEHANGLLIVAAARPEWRPPDELMALFDSPSSAGEGSQTEAALISLAPLTPEATQLLVEELCQRVGGMPGEIIDLLVERSEGVPYFAEEMVNWFIDRGVLDTRGEQWRFLPDRLKEQVLPPTLQHLLLARLAGLSSGERAALQRGAIFGRRFWTAGVEALGVPAGTEMLARLRSGGFIESLPEPAFQGDTEWGFVHSLLQEVTYQSVLKSERAALHRVAAGWLERHAAEAGRLDEFAGLLGEHFEQAGDLSAAAEWYLRAGRQAKGQGALRAARDFYRRALELLPPVDRERRWLALAGREEALSVLGEGEPWGADVAALLELAHTFDDDRHLAEAYSRQALYGKYTGNYPVCEAASREAVAAARRCGNEQIEAKTLAVAASAAVNLGKKDAALCSIEEALELARRLGDEDVLSFVLRQAGFCYGMLGDIVRVMPILTEQIELDHRRGNRSAEAHGLANLSAEYYEAGLFKQARALAEQCRAINRALGARRMLAHNLMDLGFIYLATGDLRNARQACEQAVQEISLTGDGRAKAMALGLLGQVLLALGDAPAAARRFAEAHELASRHGLLAIACESAAGLAASALMDGRPDEARGYVHEAWDYVQKHGSVGMNDEATFYRTCPEIFDALGEQEKAQAAIETGYRIVMARADAMHEPGWRQSMLDNVPAVRAIVEMWEQRNR